MHTPQTGALEILEIQRDILRRRRRRLIALALRLVAFVLLPTILMAYYYAAVATPLYASMSEFVIQQADAPSARGGSLLQTSPMATAQDAMTVQGYLMSRGAMVRLNEDAGFAAAFAAPGIDPIIRLAPDAGLEEMFRTYSRQIRIGFDPTEGIVKLEVRAPDPLLATAWSQALLGYAEERVDTLSQRLRSDQMAGAEESLAEAEAKLLAARERLIGLQERFRTMSGKDEIEIVNTKISTLERELTNDRLGLQQILSNQNPNAARDAALAQRIDRLEAEIEALRARLIEADDLGLSLARVQGEMMIAEAELDTRQDMLREAMQAREQALIEANRQVRYLSVSVNPLPADEAAYPRVFENTAIAFLNFLGIYLMLALTAAVLREQVSS
ncbi:MAG: capsule biosynthesis protein [Alphaproteobacteria bacterium]|nr:capsule biosynthesis protein [Alphaproteobacteria bacterium]